MGKDEEKGPRIKGRKKGQGGGKGQGLRMGEEEMGKDGKKG